VSCWNSFHKTKPRVVHHTRHKPQIVLKPSRPKLKHIATSIETQIEIENNSRNSTTAVFENHFIVRSY